MSPEDRQPIESSLVGAEGSAGVEDLGYKIGSTADFPLGDPSSKVVSTEGSLLGSSQGSCGCLGGGSHSSLSDS